MGHQFTAQQLVLNLFQRLPWYKLSKVPFQSLCNKNKTSPWFVKTPQVQHLAWKEVNNSPPLVLAQYESYLFRNYWFSISKQKDQGLDQKGTAFGLTFKWKEEIDEQVEHIWEEVEGRMDMALGNTQQQKPTKEIQDTKV